MKRLIKRSQTILAMADDRRKILDDCYNYSHKLAEHIIKCVVYGSNFDAYDGWVREIVAYIEDVNSMKPKKGFKLKPRDYKDNLFVGIGTELQDAKRELMRFHRKFVEEEVKPLPDFEITYMLYSRVFDAFNEISETISSRLGKYPSDNAKEIIKNTVVNILAKYE